jgi:hypothetical protein
MTEETVEPERKAPLEAMLEARPGRRGLPSVLDIVLYLLENRVSPIVHMY